MTLASDKAYDAVVHWQVARLRASYADFLAHPDYAQGMGFLIDELFLSPDQSKSQADLKKVLPLMQKLLPTTAVATIKHAEALKQVTTVIYQRWANALPNQKTSEDAILEAYQHAQLETYQAEQLERLLHVADGLFLFVNKKPIRRLIGWAKGPATLMNVLDLHVFIEKGFEAFYKVPALERMREALAKREALVHQALVQGQPKKHWWGNAAASATRTTLPTP